MVRRVTLGILAPVLFIAACATTPAHNPASSDSSWLGEFSSVPLPPNIRETIEPPTHLPKELAIFSGIWGGVGYQYKVRPTIVLAVMSITSTGWCIATYGWDFDLVVPRSGYRTTANCRIKEGTLRVWWGDFTATYRYIHERDELDNWNLGREGTTNIRLYRLYTPPPTSK